MAKGKKKKKKKKKNPHKHLMQQRRGEARWARNIEAIKAAKRGEGDIITNHGGAIVHSLDDATTCLSIPTMEEASAALYRIYHAKGVLGTRYSIPNPSASAPPPGCILPDDAFLVEEEKRLAEMSLSDFVNHSLKLIEELDLPGFGVLVYLDEKEFYRLTATLYVFEELVERIGGYPISVTVHGPNANQNQIFLKQFLNDVFGTKSNPTPYS